MKPLVCPLCGGRLERNTISLGLECFHCGTKFDDSTRPIIHQKSDRGDKGPDIPAGKWSLRTSEAREAYRLGILSAMDYQDYLQDKGYRDRDIDVLITIAERG